MVKLYLNQDFRPIYEEIVGKELTSQQKKINKKLAELVKLKEKLATASGGLCRSLKAKEGKLLKQIDHIKVVMLEVECYSVRSCKAFFQGEIEESLKILYLKNDPVMRKKYYFEDALGKIS